MCKIRISALFAVMVFSVTLRVEHVFAFAEEPLAFRDPASMVVWDGEESTIHTELTYFLALAAGFSEQNAARIAVWDQLVDSEKLGSGDAVTYSNCQGSYKTPPDRNTVCPDGYGAGQQIWPMTFDNSCATSRFGPYSPFFHFPHNNDAELVVLKEWGWGRRQNLSGYAAYAWGGTTDTVLTAKCRYMEPEIIETGITPGTLEAFGTYLHSLADYYSHSACLTALSLLSQQKLWGTHTIVPQTETLACYYVPSEPKNSDAHGQEFGATGQGIARTDAAAAVVFDELVWRSTQMEGEYQPLDMTTKLASMPGTPTLQEAISQFIRNWDFQKVTGINPNPGEYAENRRIFSDSIATAILAQRTLLPPVSCNNGPVWLGGAHYEPSIQSAYQKLNNSGVLKIEGMLFPPGNLDFTDTTKNLTVKLLGGYDCSYNALSGRTTIAGKVTINTGKVIMDRIAISK